MTGPSKPTDWGEALFKAVVIAFVSGGAMLDWQTNVSNARMDATINSHISGHPDADLTLRIDRLQQRVDRQAGHIRELERELRLKRGQD